jgi:hypothetical protein
VSAPVPPPELDTIYVKNPKRIMEVVMKPRKTFRELDEEYSSGDDERFHDPPCPRCERAKRDCEKNPKGGACLGCRRGKCKCPFAKDQKEKEKEKETKQPQAKERKAPKEAKAGGKKRKAADDGKLPAARTQAAAAVKKGKGRATPQSKEYIEDSDEEMAGPEEEDQEEEEEEEERKTKRPRLRRTYADAQGKSLKNHMNLLNVVFSNRSAPPAAGGANDWTGAHCPPVQSSLWAAARSRDAGRPFDRLARDLSGPDPDRRPPPARARRPEAHGQGPHS